MTVAAAGVGSNRWRGSGLFDRFRSSHSSSTKIQVCGSQEEECGTLSVLFDVVCRVHCGGVARSHGLGMSISAFIVAVITRPEGDRQGRHGLAETKPAIGRPRWSFTQHGGLDLLVPNNTEDRNRCGTLVFS
jgi:hypothetical protein